MTISIPAPAWGATGVDALPVLIYQFQFPPPRGGRHTENTENEEGLQYFNSRPRGGGDAVCVADIVLAHISIPAPAWGGDVSSAFLPVMFHLFQFPPPRGGRRAYRKSMTFSLLFQFPPPRGGRRNLADTFFITIIFQFPPPRGGRLITFATSADNTISIPAPAWGATQTSARPATTANFNSRPRVGGDAAR